MAKSIFVHKKEKKAASLKMKLFAFFSGYLLVIIGILFLFQEIYLEKTYELSRIFQIRQVAQFTKDTLYSTDNTRFIEKKADEYNVAILVVNENSGHVKMVNSAEMDKTLSNIAVANFWNVTGGMNFDEDTFVFIEDNNQIITVSGNYMNFLKKFKFKSKGVFFVTEGVNRYNQPINIIIYGSIAPVQATIIAIREQIVLIGVLMFILSIVLSMSIYRTISNPIKEVNKLTKKITAGNYNVVFKQNDYAEIQELANSLNNMTVQLGKVEKTQRELIANVSHDLRTPLTMISGYGEVIRDIPNENNKENIQVIIDEANRLTKLVNNMLDASKLEATEASLNIKQINVEEFVYEIYNSYSKMLEYQDYHFILNYDDRLTYMSADYIKLQQVLRNLINNAVKYCGKDKEIILNVKQKNKNVRFEVIDHGEGIQEDQLQLIWNRYYKVEKNNNRSYDGSGLGLAIVKKILELHNVDYGVISKINEGTTFYFEIPICDK